RDPHLLNPRGRDRDPVCDSTAAGRPAGSVKYYFCCFFLHFYTSFKKFCGKKELLKFLFLFQIVNARLFLPFRLITFSLRAVWPGSMDFRYKLSFLSILIHSSNE